MSLSSVVLLLSALSSIQFSCCEKFILKEKFDWKAIGDVKVRNNIWGQGGGPQVLTGESGSQWCAKCSHGSSGGIKSYPHSGVMIEKKFSTLKTIDSTFGGSVEETGKSAFSFTYDIWCQNHTYEIMLWMTMEGPIGPLGTALKDNINVGGYTWKVSKGTNGANAVFSFINTKPTFKGTVHIKDIVDWIITQKWIAEGAEVMVDEVQCGFEITSTPDNAQFCINAFGVTVS